MGGTGTRSLRQTCLGSRVLLPHLALLLAPALIADSPSWGIQSVRATGISSIGTVQTVLNGNIYLATLGGLQKMDSTGRLIYSVAIAGGIEWFSVGADGNIYLVGVPEQQFVATAGTYTPTVTGGSFLCKSRGTDGSILYCAYTDVTFLTAVGADATGNAYVAGLNCSLGYSLLDSCVEKFNSSGNALVYETSLAAFGPAGADVAVTDASGNLYIAGFNGSGLTFFVAKLDGGGRLLGSTAGKSGEFIRALQLDPSGNPQMLIGYSNAAEEAVVRRYASDLSTVLFETQVSGFLPSLMLVGPDGGTALLGRTNEAFLPNLHPAAVCNFPSAPYSGALARLDGAGHLVQSTYLASATAYVSGFMQASGATVLFNELTNQQLAIVTLGPMPEIQLACVSNAAALGIGPLAPEEIVSLFGLNLGPAVPVSGQPGADNLYPKTLGGTQVTFDGIPAPIFYASANQFNAVTPAALLPGTPTHVCVVVNGAATNCIDAPVQSANPGIFLSGATYGYAAALNEDSTINSQSNPAPAGSVVSMFGTGLGTVNPVPPDGSVIGFPLPVQDQKVQVLSILGYDVHHGISSPIYGSINVLYAGPAPFEINGLSQINIEVRSSFGLILQVGSEPQITSAAPVTVWVR